MIPGSTDWMPEAFSYVAIADGEKRHNMARIYGGHFCSKGHRVPAVIVVKCGTPNEATQPKPGNRGKRDSQILLMNFLSKVLFGDRMTPLEYDLYRKIRYLTHITADKYEAALCVDADTKVIMMEWHLHTILRSSQMRSEICFPYLDLIQLSWGYAEKLELLIRVHLGSRPFRSLSISYHII